MECSLSDSCLKGCFNLELGSGDYPIPSTDQLDRKLWVGITVGEGTEMQPLAPLTAVPYALNIPDKSVTREKISADYISYIMVDGKKISGNGTPINVVGRNGMVIDFDTSLNQLTFYEKGVIGGQGKQEIVYQPCAGVNDNDDDSEVTNTIVGGCGNKTVNSTTPAFYASILGGLNNQATGVYSTIGGGMHNDAIGAHATVAGGTYNNAQGDNSAIAGGGYNNATGTYSFVGGGSTNTASSSDAVVAGGYVNQSTAYYSSILGGHWNSASGSQSVIGGGYSNLASAEFAAIVGGDDNTASGTESFVGGGNSNEVSSALSVIVGGDDNTASQSKTFIGSGFSNLASAEFAAIVGGDDNTASGTKSFVGGGNSNEVSAALSVIVGGDDNTASQPKTFIGGGLSNLASAEFATIVGGDDNTVSGAKSFVGSGNSNEVSAALSVIVGGDDNTIDGNITSGSFIGGGKNNELKGSYSFVGGGLNNDIGLSTPLYSQEIDYSSIVGGSENKILTLSSEGNASFIGGGSNNRIESDNSVIGGGTNNQLINTAFTTSCGFIGGGVSNVIGGSNYSSIVAGTNNSIGADYSTVGGGETNVITFTAPYIATHMTIPGGDNLIAQSYGQTVLGYYNKAQGISVLGAVNPSDRILIIGNGLPGNPPLRKNAYEVSNNGHSIVYHRNGSAAPAIRGARYTDNTAIAWGFINNTGNLVPGASFGVSAAVPSGFSTVTVDLNYTDPYSGAQVPVVLNESAVVATIEDDETGSYCSYIVAKPVVWNAGAGKNQVVFRTFYKDIDQDPISKDITVDCKEERRAFMFVIFARPATQYYLCSRES
jgi:hypothetical protein